MLNVTAAVGEKDSTNRKTITITNDKSRLSKEEIDKMVSEAEKFAEDDRKAFEKVEARNELENYAYSVKNTLNEITERTETANKALDASESTLQWLETHRESEKSEYNDRKKSLETLIEAYYVESKLNKNSSVHDNTKQVIEEVD
jgi:L1 cell adhesion molecule like protein